MSVRVDCPGCGGPVVFAAGSSLVAVCPHCRSAVARGDRSVETLGKVADLVETGALLKVGLTGKYDGVGFRLTGRVQLAHEAGGVWDEWYAAFDDGRWGWLAEAQGRFHLLFEQPKLDRWPVYDTLDPGEPVELAGAPRLVVAETGRATAKGAEGEIPYRFRPGETYPYADLSGPGGAFATLDYSRTPPGYYLGRQVSLDDLGVPPDLRREVYELRRVEAKQVNCPNCGGPLALRAPDKTERVGCPYCGSLLDATKGGLKVLKALSKPPFELAIPLGTVGKFPEGERTVIGAFLRTVTAEGVDYPWQEYLLYHPRDGFEWLIRANNHWTRAKGIPAADVQEGKYVSVYDGRQFRAFQGGKAIVRGVVGECYWKVTVGETAEALDYIRPPELLSVERQTFGGSREVNWSHGTYLTPKEVEAAFGLKDPLPAPEGVAPNQPFPYGRVYKLAARYVAALCALGLLLLIFLPNRKVHEQTFQLRPLAGSVMPPPAALPAVAGTAAAAAPPVRKPPPPAPPALPAVAGTGVTPPPPAGPPERTQVFFTELFELRGGQNLRVTVGCPNLTGWLAVEGDLVRQEDGQTQPFVLPLTYYAGVDEGEAWAEGEKTDYLYLNAQPRGQYSLRLEVERENPQVSGPLTVRVEQGVPHFKNWLLALLGLLLIPVGLAIYHVAFVSRRWSTADFSMFQTDQTAAASGTPDAAAAETGQYAAERFNRLRGKRRTK